MRSRCVPQEEPARYANDAGNRAEMARVQRNRMTRGGTARFLEKRAKNTHIQTLRGVFGMARARYCAAAAACVPSIGRTWRAKSSSERRFFSASREIGFSNIARAPVSSR